MHKFTGKKFMNTTKLPELLAPVGNMDQLEAAILYGADAVYLGGSASLRAGRPFSEEDLLTARLLTKKAGVALFFCCNAFPRGQQIISAQENLEMAAKAEVDAYIIADVGVFSLAKKNFSHIPIHVSTQANTCNAESVAFWYEQGAERVNLARELRFTEIRSIANKCPQVELECFVHGAQCLAISGQCLLSAWLNDRPANAGQCTQPCRFEYRALPEQSLHVEEKLRSGDELWEITQGVEGFSAFWAPEDLCLLPFVPWFVRKKISALKIEGRMRTGAYVAHAVDIYRRALNFCANFDATPLNISYEKQKAWRELLPRLLSELAKWSTRDLGTGFFLPKHQVLAKAHTRGRGGLSPLLARLEQELKPNVWKISVRSQWSVNTNAYVFMPDGEHPLLQKDSYFLENHRGERVDCVHPGMEAILHTELSGLVSGAYIEAV